MVTCKDANGFLMDYLENRLSGEVKKALEYHLSLCKTCVKFVNTYKKTIQLTGRLSIEKMPARLEKTLLRFLAKSA